FRISTRVGTPGKTRGWGHPRYNRVRCDLEGAEGGHMKPTWKVLGLMIAGCVLTVLLQPVTSTPAAQKGSNWDATHDQSTAVGCIRSINTAEVYFAKEYKNGWSPTLAALGVPPEGVKPSATAAGLLDNSLTGG